MMIVPSLHVIFVSSECSVMPLISSTSSRLRAAPVTEITDLPEEFLITLMHLTEDVISLTGDQLSQMIIALYVYENATDKSNVLNIIKEELCIKFVGKRLQEIYNHKNNTLAISIMKLMVSRGNVNQEKLTLIYRKEGYKDEEVSGAIDLLVFKKFLRYQRNVMKFNVVKWS